MTSTFRNEITIKPFYLHMSQENKRIAHYEIILTEMKFLQFLFGCFDFYRRFVYVGSVLFWCFRCKLKQLHRCRSGVSYCKYCLI